MLRVPRFDRQDVSPVHEQDGGGPAGPGQEETREESEAPCRPAAPQTLHKGNSKTRRPPDSRRSTFTVSPPVSGSVVQRSCAGSSAAATLRTRLPPFEELRLDEEVATYSAVCVSPATRPPLPRPRCGNPLAATLRFEESSVRALLADRGKSSLHLKSFIFIFESTLIPDIK